MWPSETANDYPVVIAETLKLDLRYWSAVWAATHFELDNGRPMLPYRVAAALFKS